MTAGEGLEGWREVARRLLADWDTAVYDRGTSRDMRQHGAIAKAVEAAIAADDPDAALAAMEGYC